MHPSVSNAIGEIDAAFFSGDGFHDKEKLDEIQYYLARWMRESVDVRKMLNEIEEESSNQLPTEEEIDDQSKKKKIEEIMQVVSERCEDEDDLDLFLEEIGNIS